VWPLREHENGGDYRDYRERRENDLDRRKAFFRRAVFFANVERRWRLGRDDSNTNRRATLLFIVTLGPHMPHGFGEHLDGKRVEHVVFG
jgi:hypothetical protein